MGNMGVPFIPNLGKMGKVGKPFTLANFQLGEPTMSGQKNILCDGIFIYCDDDGGGLLWELPEDEAVRLFRCWLRDQREGQQRRQRQIQHEQEHKEAVATARASFKVFSGSKA